MKVGGGDTGERWFRQWIGIEKFQIHAAHALDEVVVEALQVGMGMDDQDSCFPEGFAHPEDIPDQAVFRFQPGGLWAGSQFAEVGIGQRTATRSAGHEVKRCGAQYPHVAEGLRVDRQ